jgi:hypothetical protein
MLTAIGCQLQYAKLADRTYSKVVVLVDAVERIWVIGCT